MLFMFFINALIVMLSVIVHYEFLSRLTILMAAQKTRRRFNILVGVYGAFIAHTLEIWIFAVAYYLLGDAKSWGYLEGNFDGSLMDCAYFSFTTYSTLGFGDITPHGDLRYLTGIESLIGLILITWTASFLFVEMQKHWNSKH